MHVGGGEESGELKSRGYGFDRDRGGRGGHVSI